MEVNFFFQILSYQNGLRSVAQVIVHADQGIEKREYSFIAVENENLYTPYGYQYGSI